MRPSLSPSSRVARCDRGLVNQRIFLRRDVAGRIFQRGLRHPQSLDGAVRPVQNRRPGGDTVEIVRKFLRFLQPLLAAGRAANPIGKLGIVAIECFDHRLGLERHFMLGAPREIDQFFRVPQSETAACAAMAGVGGTGGISVQQGLSHGGIADRAGPSAISDGLILPVPVCLGQPDLDFNVGIRAGPSMSPRLGRTGGVV